MLLVIPGSGTARGSLPTGHRSARFCDPGLIERRGEHLPGYASIARGQEHRGPLGELVRIVSPSVRVAGVDPHEESAVFDGERDPGGRPAAPAALAPAPGRIGA